jgi:hypothetical protein
VREGDVPVLYVVCGALHAGFSGGIVMPNYTLGHREQDARKIFR